MAKLYFKMSHLLFKKRTHPWERKRLKFGITLKVGDIINDCTWFNARIVSIEPEVAYLQYGHRGGRYIYDITFRVSPYGGFCTLNHCGIEPPKPQDEVERNALAFALEAIDDDFYKDRKDYIAMMHKRIEALQSGKHITDDNGMLLKEFLEFPNEMVE